jgi:HSP20 family protein
MFATRWEPFAEMNRLGREMEKLFGNYGKSTPRLNPTNVYPAINMWEDEDNTYLEAELPGFTADGIDVHVSGNQLSLAGERQLPKMEGGQWCRQERGFGKFHRSFELPFEMDEAGITADFHHGVLTITLPKCEAAKPRRIKVNA